MPLPPAALSVRSGDALIAQGVGDYGVDATFQPRIDPRSFALDDAPAARHGRVLDDRPGALVGRRREALAHDRGVLRMQMHAHLARRGGQLLQTTSRMMAMTCAGSMRSSRRASCLPTARASCNKLFSTSASSSCSGRAMNCNTESSRFTCASNSAMRALHFGLCLRHAGFVAARLALLPGDTGDRLRGGRGLALVDRPPDDVPSTSGSDQRSTTDGGREIALWIRHTPRPCRLVRSRRTRPACGRSAGSPSARPRLRRCAPGPWLRGRPSAFRRRAVTCS